MVSAPQPMLIRAPQAAKVLSICERTLWTLVNRGEIPRLKVGKTVLYDPSDLLAWISQRKAASMVVV